MNLICKWPESKGRLHQEPDSKNRSPFQRDRDRIIHCQSFRRLEYKTQVFVNYESDHFRTRLTHSLEVAQVARSIAKSRACRPKKSEKRAKAVIKVCLLWFIK